MHGNKYTLVKTTYVHLNLFNEYSTIIALNSHCNGKRWFSYTSVFAKSVNCNFIGCGCRPINFFPEYVYVHLSFYLDYHFPS